MIGKLKGKIIFKGENYIILDVGGVGYKIFIAPDALKITRSSAPGNTGEEKPETAELWTYLQVKENALDLYGFSSQSELQFFEMLIGISGVGPKSALGILSVASADTLRRAIASGDKSYLAKVGGIGRKTAEKIVVELKEKLGGVDGAEIKDENLRGEEDVLDALQSLGYSAREARDALRKIPQDTEGTEKKIKEALRVLGKH